LQSKKGTTLPHRLKPDKGFNFAGPPDSSSVSTRQLQDKSPLNWKLSTHCRTNPSIGLLNSIRIDRTETSGSFTLVNTCIASMTGKWDAFFSWSTKKEWIYTQLPEPENNGIKL